MFVCLFDFFFFLGRLLVELFPSIFTQREGERKKNVTDSAKRHRESSELFKPAADLGTARYTPIRGRRRRPSSPTLPPPHPTPPASHSLTHSPVCCRFDARWRQRQKFQLKYPFVMLSVQKGRKGGREGGKEGGGRQRRKTGAAFSFWTAQEKIKQKLPEVGRRGRSDAGGFFCRHQTK